MLRMLFQQIGLHYANGNFAAVESAVHSILTTVPNDLASMQFLGLIYYRTGRKAEAMKIFSASPFRKNSAPQFEPEPAGDLPDRNDYSAVAACQLAATHRNSDLALVWYDLGLTMNRLGRPDRAASAFRSALTARPAFPDAVLAMQSLAPEFNGPAAAEGEHTRHALTSTDGSPDSALDPGDGSRRGAPRDEDE